MVTEFGRGRNTVAAECGKQTSLYEKLKHKSYLWKTHDSQVQWWVEQPFHITLGSYRTEQVDQKNVDEIREAFENELNNRTYGYKDLLPVSLANL